ncbi:hypothetical protein [Bartonella rattaustraliani]|uniref:hypothetical protein n=1 Tax=Bartonella rattaustraliani TaxID=481139 RepID=UPI0012E9E648|nr:hypothetical protein [Bartonella rattaustraliani]
MFFIVRLIHMICETILHDMIEDRLRATYESFLATIMRSSLMIVLPFTAYLIECYGFSYIGYCLILLGGMIFGCNYFKKNNTVIIP